MNDHTTAVDRPEVDDPRVLALAVARQQMAYESPFNFVCPPWDGLSEQEQHLSLLDARNYLRAALKAGLVPAVVPSVGVPALRDRVRRAVCEAEGFAWDSSMLEPDEYGDVADAVLAALPAPADRAAVLTEAAEAVAKHVARAIFALKSPQPPGSEHYRSGWDDGLEAAIDAARDELLRRLAGEAAPDNTETSGACDEQIRLLRLTLDAVEEGRRELRSENAQLRARLWTLAAMLEGLNRLLATSSRDWGEYRVDAWLWAVLCGWDCEQATHDETCTHGAMEEMQQRHGWDDDTVAKARRYRAVVHTLTAAETVVEAEPTEEPGP